MVTKKSKTEKSGEYDYMDLNVYGLVFPTEKSGEYDYMDLFVFPGKMQKREIT